MKKILTTPYRNHIKNDTYVTLCGKDYTLDDLLKMKCPSFIAARRLEKNLKKLKIKTVQQLWNLGPYSLYNTVGVGITQVFVAECIIFNSAAINPGKWYQKHLNPRKKRHHEI